MFSWTHVKPNMPTKFHGNRLLNTENTEEGVSSENEKKPRFDRVKMWIQDG